MSGVCGVYYPGGQPAAPDALEPVMAALRAYGRDGSDEWRDGPVALGHQMTWVTPESLNETLPFVHTQAGLVITADARIDNRDALFDMLQVPRAAQADMPDSQIIVRAYERWGTDCAAHLLGDFAFALWDSREQRLFCARDVVGARPFYYAEAAGVFRFASDIEALFCFPGVPRQLDPDYVLTYLQQSRGQFHHNERTFYRHLRKLPPAHALIISREGLRVWPYWQPGQTPEIRLASDEEYAEMMREIVHDAVACRLRSAYPVGAHISGGLDSTAIAVLAARGLRNGAQPFTAFAWAPDHATVEQVPKDERDLIEDVCQREGIDLAYTTATPADFIANQTRDITTQPTHTLRYEMRVSRLAAERGIRVMLSGWGGDEFATFNGRGYMASLFLSGRWISLLRELNLRRVIRRSPLHVTTLRRVVAPLLPNSVLPWLSWRTIRWLYITYAPPQPLPNCLHAAFAARLHQASPLPRTHTREVPGVRTNQIELLQLGHLAARMESWADNGAEHGVDYRYPLLDQRVIEFCLSIPDHLFFRHGWHRYLFREACRGILPERVRWIRNKRDPAVVAQASSVVPQSKDLLIAALRERQNSIQHAQMVDAGCLINGLSQQPDQPDMQMSHAWRALWLAFVSPEAHL